MRGRVGVRTEEGEGEVGSMWGERVSQWCSSEQIQRRSLRAEEAWAILGNRTSIFLSVLVEG